MEQQRSKYSPKNQGISEFLSPLFWEYDPHMLDTVTHADLIIARIMEYGNWAAMLWLQRVYSKERLRGFLESRGKNILPPRELNYWALICEVPLEKRQQWLQQTKETANVWRTRHTH